MDIGEVEGEIEGSDDQIDELSGARKPRRDERSTHQRRPGKQPRRASPLGRHEKREADNELDRPSGRHEKREADNGHDSVKNQKRKKRALWCATTVEARDTQRDSARHLRTMPLMLLTRKVTLRRNRPTKVMCVELSGNATSMVQVTKMMTSWEWDVSPKNKARGSASQLWWTLAQQKTFYLQASAIMLNSVQPAGLMRALDFVEPAERESAITVRGTQGSNERRAYGGNHMASGGREETAHVSGQDDRSR